MNKTRTASKWIVGLAVSTALVFATTAAPAQAADTGWNPVRDTGWNPVRDTGWNPVGDTGWNPVRDTGWNPVRIIT